LVVSAALAAGCAAASPPSEFQQATVGDGGAVVDLAGQPSGCVDGSSCSTGNPGVCSTGHIVCAGGVPTCVPDALAQVQEICFNDLDDDCDGTINNGCPDHFVTGTPRQLTAHGNATGGNPFSLRCPANSFLTKITQFGDGIDGYLSGLDIFCGAPTLVRGPSSYSVTVAAVTASPASIRGVTSAGATSSFDCGTGFVPGWWTTGEYDSAGLDKLGMFCGTSAVSLSPTNQLTVTLTKQGTGVPDGYAFAGTTPFEDDCAQGEVLIGYDGRSGDWIDQLQAVCAPLSVVYK